MSCGIMSRIISIQHDWISNKKSNSKIKLEVVVEVHVYNGKDTEKEHMGYHSKFMHQILHIENNTRKGVSKSEYTIRHIHMLRSTQ